MASIDRRGKQWRAQVRRAGHRRLSKSFTTKTQARNWASQTRGDGDRVEIEIESARRLSWAGMFPRNLCHTIR